MVELLSKVFLGTQFYKKEHIINMYYRNIITKDSHQTERGPINDTNLLASKDVICLSYICIKFNNLQGIINILKSDFILSLVLWSVTQILLPSLYWKPRIKEVVSLKIQKQQKASSSDSSFTFFPMHCFYSRKSLHY